MKDAFTRPLLSCCYSVRREGRKRETPRGPGGTKRPLLRRQNIQRQERGRRQQGGALTHCMRAFTFRRLERGRLGLWSSWITRCSRSSERPTGPFGRGGEGESSTASNEIADAPFDGGNGSSCSAGASRLDTSAPAPQHFDRRSGRSTSSEPETSKLMGRASLPPRGLEGSRIHASAAVETRFRKWIL